MWADGGGGVAGDSEEIGRVDWGSSWRFSASRIGSYPVEDVLVGDGDPWRYGGTEEPLASDEEESEGLLVAEGGREAPERALERRWGWSLQRAAMEMRLAAMGWEYRVSYYRV
jgi:hypothetical protein